MLRPYIVIGTMLQFQTCHLKHIPLMEWTAPIAR